jgi:hypothetical protein
VLTIDTRANQVPSGLTSSTSDAGYPRRTTPRPFNTDGAFRSAPDRTRTCDPKFRKLVLYPPELRGRRPPHPEGSELSKDNPGRGFRSTRANRSGVGGEGAESIR